MWKPYLSGTSEELPNAINVLDRFYIMQKFGKTIDKVRAEEANSYSLPLSKIKHQLKCAIFLLM